MEIIAPRVKSYTGVDFSAPFIKAAIEMRDRIAIRNAEFVCSDIKEFCSQRPNAFDAGFAMDFSEHVGDSEWTQILENIRKSLKPGGMLYVHTPNAEFFLEIMKKSNMVLRQFPEHIAVRTPEQNSAILGAAGFQVMSIRFLPHYNALKAIHPLSFLPVIGRYFRARLFIKAKA